MPRTMSRALLDGDMDRERARRHAGDYRFTGGETEHGHSAAEPIAQIASILGRANFHCVVSGLRVGLRATKRLCQGHMRVMDHMMRSDSPREHALRIIVDETRGCLREVSEASSQEVRRLQVELGKLQDEARGIIGEPDTSANEYRRAWKIKR